MPITPRITTRLLPAWLFLSAVLIGTYSLAFQSRPTSAPSNDDEPRLVCRIQSPRIDEASGLLVGRANPGVFYTHNDSGGAPEVYVIAADGALRATIVLDGAKNVDWEDIAFAPGERPGRYDIVAADIGDNNDVRHDIRLYRFAEPDLPPRAGSMLHVTPTVYPLRYEIGPANAEAFIVTQRSGDGYIITKRAREPALVLKVAAPWSANVERMCPKVAEIDLPIEPGFGKSITAADLSPDDSTLAIRTYLAGFLLRNASSPASAPTSIESIFKAIPERIDLATEPQGEAICFSPDGRRLYTTSEGKHPAIYETILPHHPVPK